MTDQDQPRPETPETENTIDEALGDFLGYQRKAISEVGKALESMVPDGVRTHGQSAFKEMVEGYRGLFNAALDEVIERIEQFKVEPRDDKPDE